MLHCIIKSKLFDIGIPPIVESTNNIEDRLNDSTIKTDQTIIFLQNYKLH